MVFGSEAALRLLPELSAERVRIGSDLPDVVERLRAAAGKKRVAIAATGDPRTIVSDPQARYAGAVLQGDELTARDGARIGTMNFATWLATQPSATE